jgi:hypothetical protein
MAQPPARAIAFDAAMPPPTLNCPPVQASVVADTEVVEPFNCWATARLVTLVLDAPM